MTIIINTLNKRVVECKHFIFKVEIEMYVGGSDAWERGLTSLLSSPATLPSTVLL